ncbi:SIS domain-containing protein, partial [Flavobacteriaceae bacterium]|nr:SIS domain-containing protein [Flavobacteriaceae bacterium]
SYEKKYIECINKGLSDSICKIDTKEVSMDNFFTSITNFLKNTVKNKGKIYFFGNGASASFSNHMALDWSKNGGILSFSLSDSSMLTALANDYSYEEAFLEFLKINNPTEYDLVITTSSSGNSPNIVSVLNYCSINNITTLGLSGLKEDNKSVQLSTYSLFVPMKTYGMVECIHQVFHHLLLDKYMAINEWEKLESQNMNSNNFKL